MQPFVLFDIAFLKQSCGIYTILRNKLFAKFIINIENTILNCEKIHSPIHKYQKSFNPHIVLLQKYG